MNVSRRPATAADMEFARSVHHRAYREVIELQYGSWSVDAQDKFFADAWSADTHETILCTNTHILMEWQPGEHAS